MNGKGVCYQIYLKGELDQTWAEWLGGGEITTLEGGYTLIRIWFEDQAALYGFLGKLRDLNLTLISVGKQ